MNVDDESSVRDAPVWMYTIIKSADIKNKEVSSLSSLKDDSVQQILDKVKDNIAFYDAVQDHAPQMVRFNALIEDDQPGQLEYSVANVQMSEESYYSSFMNFLTKRVVDGFNWWYDKAFAADLTSSFVAGGIAALLLLSAWYIGERVVSNIKSLFCTSEFVDSTYSIQALLGAEDLNDNQTRVRKFFRLRKRNSSIAQSLGTSCAHCDSGVPSINR